MQVGDVRRFMEAAVDRLSPAKARELAKGLLEGGASREQLQKAQQELIDWSTRNRNKLVGMIQHEVTKQMKSAGFATRSEVEAVRKRVRALEKEAGIGKKSGSGTGTAKRSSRTRAPGSAAGDGR